MKILYINIGWFYLVRYFLLVRVSGEKEQLNISRQSAGTNKVLYASQVAQVNKGNDSFNKNAYVTMPKAGSILNPGLNYFNSPKLILRTYLNPKSIDSMVQNNPKVKEILDNHGVEYSIHPENVSKIINTHITTTTAYALQIANKLGLNAYDKQLLEQACVFHDFGKVLIPDEILNKPDKLTTDEKDIMSLHSELGYELLSQTNLNKRVLDLVRNHHNPGTDDLLAQILSVADMYSALREVRCYKEPLTNKEAIEILDQKAMNGEVSAEVVNALKSSVPADSLAA